MWSRRTLRSEVHSLSYSTPGQPSKLDIFSNSKLGDPKQRKKKSQPNIQFSKNLLESQKKMQEESRSFREVFWAKFDDDLRQMMNLKIKIFDRNFSPSRYPPKLGEDSEKEIYY